MGDALLTEAFACCRTEDGVRGDSAARCVVVATAVTPAMIGGPVADMPAARTVYCQRFLAEPSGSFTSTRPALITASSVLGTSGGRHPAQLAHLEPYCRFL